MLSVADTPLLGKSISGFIAALIRGKKTLFQMDSPYAGIEIVSPSSEDQHL